MEGPVFMLYFLLIQTHLKVQYTQLTRRVCSTIMVFVCRTVENPYSSLL